MHYVIIGNSAAAIGCIEGIRQIDQKGEITVISNEKYKTYSRPLISYLLCGKTDLKRMKYRSDSFYEENRVKLLLEKTVVKILEKEKKVLLSDNQRISYDKLLVATGSSPFVPPMDGLETVPQKFTFMSLDDALSLQKVLTKKSRVLIVGAGLIGLKCAEGIFDHVRNITVVDLADRILPSILDEDASKIVKSYLEKKGIEFYLSDSVERFSKNTALLKSGMKLEYDILVIAVGVRPNVSLADNTSIKADRGIETDLYCKTTADDIYAAGDCAKSHDLVLDQDRILALLPNAYMQGECAGINMAGGNRPFDRAMAMNAIGFFGLHMITAGSYDGDSYVDKTKTSYKKLVTKDDRLVGYILVGSVERAGIYTSLIRKKTPLSTIDFELIREKPQLIAFSKNEREKMLGGVV